MDKSLKITLCTVMLTAVLLMTVLLSGYFADRKRLESNVSRLSDSRKTWETIAAKKETLQTELKEVQNSVREASLTLSESTERAEELKAEIEALRHEIEVLKRTP